MILLAISDLLAAATEVLIMMIGAALLAFLIAWLIFRKRYVLLKELYERTEKNYVQLSEDFDRLKESNANLKSQNAALESRIHTIENQKAELAGQLTSCIDRRESLEHQMVALKAFEHKYNNLLPVHQEKLRTISDLETKLADSLARERSLDGALKDRTRHNKELSEELVILNPFRDRALELEKTNQLLRDELSQLKSREGRNDMPSAEAESGPDEKPDVFDRIRQKAEGRIDFSRIGLATVAMKDDLKEIKGIGPFIEKKLNSIGIYSFGQIANFTLADEEIVNDVIEFFPGRIRRDRWVDQAKQFLNRKIAPDSEDGKASE
jgi:predicted flap endonuclease-1-like 5' DNA nuclease/cell division protein FtsB